MVVANNGLDMTKLQWLAIVGAHDPRLELWLSFRPFGRGSLAAPKLPFVT